MGKIVNSRKQLFTRQITCYAKNNHPTRASDAGQSFVIRGSQRVEPRSAILSTGKRITHGFVCFFRSTVLTALEALFNGVE